MADFTKEDIERAMNAVKENQSKTTGAPVKDKAPAFHNYTMYSAKDVYIGNYSMPENFSEVTKASLTEFFAKKGIRLLAPGSVKKDITMDDLE